MAEENLVSTTPIEWDEFPANVEFDLLRGAFLYLMREDRDKAAEFIRWAAATILKDAAKSLKEASQANTKDGCQTHSHDST